MCGGVSLLDVTGMGVQINAQLKWKLRHLNLRARVHCRHIIMKILKFCHNIVHTIHELALQSNFPLSGSNVAAIVAPILVLLAVCVTVAVVGGCVLRKRRLQRASYVNDRRESVYDSIRSQHHQAVNK